MPLLHINVNAITKIAVHITHGRLSRRNPVKNKTINMEWLNRRIGWIGLGISSNGINHCKQYIFELMKLIFPIIHELGALYLS